MLTRILLVAIGLAPLMALASTPPSGEGTPQKIQITTTDGLVESAWLTPAAESGKAPLWVLLPMMNHDHTSFQPFIDALSAYVKADTTKKARMPHLLSFDLRGHGESVNLKGTTLVPGKMNQADFAKIPSDVRQMIDHVIADTNYRVDAENVVVIGASIGANAAVIMAASFPAVRKVVMLSPGSDYHSLQPAEAVKKFGRPMLLYAETKDSYSAETVRTLGKLDKVNATPRIITGSEHGTDIIDDNAKIMQELLTWLYK
jgi:dienelactone hydrolase